MFLGAYWSERKESREQTAERLSNFFHSISSGNDFLSKWFYKGSSRSAARTPAVLDVFSIANNLRTNRKDIGREVIPELGFGFDLWNGGGASLSSTIGAYSRHILNSVVLSVDNDVKTFNRAEWKRLLESAVQEFDPDRAVVTDTDYLNHKGVEKPWEAGWFTYERGSQIKEHSFA